MVAPNAGLDRRIKRAKPALTGVQAKRQALRDSPQSVTVVTENLITDRRIDTLKAA